MEMTIINYIFCIVELLIVPLVFGCSICGILGMKRTIVKGMVVGYVTLWAVCQIIAVPLILLKQSFTLLIVIYTTIIVIVCIFGIYRGWLKNAISIKK